MKRWTALAAGLALAACGSGANAPPPVGSEPLVLPADSGWVLHWDGAPGGAPVPIYYGTDPEAIDHSRPIAELAGTSATITGLPRDVRPFFELAPAGGPKRIASTRLVPLEGAHNFRDFGGYRTANGSTVRWGMLYRSDDLAGLTASDLATLRGLEIRWLCDFRSDAERDEQPDRLPEADGPRVENLSIDTEGARADELRDRILSGDDADYAALMRKANRSFATAFAYRYRALFDRLADPENLPALIHCTAGKDRTGFGAALVLMALGVPRDVVFEDYLLTNYFSQSYVDRTLLMIRFGSFFRTDPETVRPLLEVRSDYLEQALEAIESRWGSVDRYLREELDVTDAEQASLRESLLRPPDV